MNAFPSFRRAMLLLLFCVATTGVLSAQTSAPELQTPFELFSSNGSLPFAKALFPDDLDQAKDFARNVDTYLGRLGIYDSYEVLLRLPLSQRVERLYLVLYFERRPMWLSLDLYRGKINYRFISWKASLQPSEVLPTDYFSRYAGRL